MKERIKVRYYWWIREGIVRMILPRSAAGGARLARRQRAGRTGLLEAAAGPEERGAVRVIRGQCGGPVGSRGDGYRSRLGVAGQARGTAGGRPRARGRGERRGRDRVLRRPARRTGRATRPGQGGRGRGRPA